MSQSQNLCCPGCGRFLAEADSPQIGTLRLRCSKCKQNVFFTNQRGLLLARYDVTTEAEQSPVQRSA